MQRDSNSTAQVCSCSELWCTSCFRMSRPLAYYTVPLLLHVTSIVHLAHYNPYCKLLEGDIQRTDKRCLQFHMTHTNSDCHLQCKWTPMCRTPRCPSEFVSHTSHAEDLRNYVPWKFCVYNANKTYRCLKPVKHCVLSSLGSA